MKLTATHVRDRVEVIATGTTEFRVYRGTDQEHRAIVDEDRAKRVLVYADPEEALADAEALTAAAHYAIEYRDAHAQADTYPEAHAEADEVEALIKKWIAATDTVDTARIHDLEQIYMPLAMEIVAARHQAARTPIADADAHADKVGFDVGGAMLKAMEDKEAQYVGPIPHIGHPLLDPQHVGTAAHAHHWEWAGDRIRCTICKYPPTSDQLPEATRQIQARQRADDKSGVRTGPPLTGRYVFERGDRVVLKASKTTPERAAKVIRVRTPQDPGYLIKLEHNGAVMRALWEDIRLAFPDENVPDPPHQTVTGVYFEMGERVLTSNLTGPENVGFVTELPAPENGGAYTVKLASSGADVRCLGEEMRRYSARNMGTGPAMDLRLAGDDD